MNKKEKKSAVIGRLIKITVFLCICVILWEGFTWLLYPRGPRRGMMSPDAAAFRNYKESHIDVYVVGNSDAYAGFSPMELWKSSGITSYVSGEPVQTLASAEYLISEFLNDKSPKYIFLETDEVFTGKSAELDLIRARADEQFPLIKYHNYWKTVNYGTFRHMPENYRPYAMGQSIRTQTVPYTGGDYMTINDSDPSKNSIMSANTVKYLDMIRKDCENYGCTLVLLNVPCAKSWSNSRHNSVEQYAEKYGIDYLDLNTCTRQLDFNWATDTSDGGEHLNVSGAAKVSHYIGKYLENKGVKDKRDSAQYAQWQKRYKKYLTKIKNNKDKAPLVIK